MYDRHGILTDHHRRLPCRCIPTATSSSPSAGAAGAALADLCSPLGLAAGGRAGYIAYFFRDPERVTPLREGLVVAPADGRITAIERDRPPAELGLGDEQRTRISIFLSVFDVHINRAPVAGRIKRSIYVPGAFLNAALDKASEDNERRSLVIETAQGTDDGGDADRRPRGAADRHLPSAKARPDRHGRALRPHPLRQPRRRLPAAGPPRRSSPSASARSAARRCSPTSSRPSHREREARAGAGAAPGARLDCAKRWRPR